MINPVNNLKILNTKYELNDTVLSEYPRPQLVRESYQSLNGWWDYKISTSRKIPSEYDGKIRVPYAIESPLSTVKRQLKPQEVLWYHKEISLDQEFIKDRVLLNFGAIDQISTIFLNQEMVYVNKGGYQSFVIDITDYLKDYKVTLDIMVEDYENRSIYSYGKQSRKRGGIWYTTQTGIWQSVFLESVSNTYIKSIQITPNIDESTVEINVETSGPFNHSQLDILDGEEIIASKSFTNNTCKIVLDHFECWSPDSPKLYDLNIRVEDDFVKSYFGMRKFDIKTIDSKQILHLNNKPIFIQGVLDQGYYSDGIFTPKHDQAIIDDIMSMKELGFNLLRKHIKIEPLRFYYHCDRLGMLVMQDAVNGGSEYNPMITQVLAFINTKIDDKNYSLFGRKSKPSRDFFYKECDFMMKHLYNCTSLCSWVPFNEGWGQFDAKKVAESIKEKDPTRWVDHVSGWYDQQGIELNSYHIYYKKIKMKPDNRVLALTEFGGYSLKIENHVSSTKKFGYRHFDTKKQLTDAYIKLLKEEVKPYIQKGLSLTVYTQLSDVEDELNGFLTYDRQILKVDCDRIKEIHQVLNNEFQQIYGREEN